VRPSEAKEWMIRKDRKAKKQKPPRTFHRLMDLPLEIRRIIYGFALVSNEAREVLYGSDTFTAVINSLSTRFLTSSNSPRSFEPFPVSPSTGYVKHWQLDVQHPRQNAKADCFYADAILEVSEEFIGINDLQTLKVKFPCVCGVPNENGNDEDDVSEAQATYMRFLLQPLKRLRFTRNVTFIAARRYANNEYSYERHGLCNEDCTVPIQCQQPGCLKYVSLLDDLKERMMSTAPSESLLEQQRQWLEVKKGVMLDKRYSQVHKKRMDYLDRLLTAVVTTLRYAEDEDARKAYLMVYDERRELLRAAKEAEKRREAKLNEMWARARRAIDYWHTVYRGR
ncbi:MAG: hypothetical protein Q9182_007591, partial [Xanthomendoza sp. 2 TL-2023]